MHYFLIRVLEIVREGRMIWAPQTTEIREGDLLLIRGDIGKVMESESMLKIEDWAEGNLSNIHLQSDDITLVEVVIPSGSSINKLLFAVLIERHPIATLC